MGLEGILFIGIGSTWGFFFLRIPYVVWQATRYVKRNYPNEWENSFQHRVGTSRFGGSSAFSLFAELKDPIVADYEKKWREALKLLLVAVAASVVVLITYILGQP